MNFFLILNPLKVGFYVIYKLYERFWPDEDHDIYAYSFCFLLVLLNFITAVIAFEEFLSIDILGKIPKVVFIVLCAIIGGGIYYRLDKVNWFERFTESFSQCNVSTKRAGFIMFIIYFICSIALLILVASK